LKDSHVVLQKSRRGAGQDDWGRIDVKVVCGLVTEAKAKTLESHVTAFLNLLEEAITGQTRMQLDRAADAQQQKAADKPVRGQLTMLPGGKKKK